jgi:phosphohistidine phosphatase
MKRLYLLRHAKSSWKDTSLPDHERPLAGRGRRAAKAIARHLREQDLQPQLVLCSTARRARETLELIQPALGAATVEFEHDLYAASADALLERLRRVPDTVAAVMLIGHNPGVQGLADILAGAAEGDARERMNRRGFPAAGFALLSFDGPWKSLEPGVAILRDYWAPAE